MKPGFTKGNKFFGRTVWCWNLPAGWSCPGARLCLAKADPRTGKIWKAPGASFTCYAARMERFPNVRAKAWANYRLLAGCTEDRMAQEILDRLPKYATHVRVHGGGDFFSRDYAIAWMLVAASAPKVKFWAFTKSPRFFAGLIIPDNFKLTQSLGGVDDDIRIHGCHTAEVFRSRSLAEASGLPIDTDDTLPMQGDCDFALIENTQKRKVTK